MRNTQRGTVGISGAHKGSDVNTIGRVEKVIGTVDCMAMQAHRIESILKAKGQYNKLRKFRIGTIDYKARQKRYRKATQSMTIEQLDACLPKTVKP